MIDTLYPCFKHWSWYGSVYIMSDPHFGDLDMNWRINLIKNKPDFTENLNEDGIAAYIIGEIYGNLSKLTKTDTLICLGDVGDPRFFDEVRGRKILIKGNHDVGDSKYMSYFDEIYGGPLMIAEKLMLSHEPIPGPWLNIHGHDHMGGYTPGLLNACVEWNGFRPMNLGKLIKSGCLSDIDSIHRITIDKASKKLTNR